MDTGGLEAKLQAPPQWVEKAAGTLWDGHGRSVRHRGWDPAIRLVANSLRRRDITATRAVEGDFMVNAELRIEAGRDLWWGRRASRRPEEGQVDTDETCSMRLVTQPWWHR